jgi:hypothetical protein
MMTMRSNPRHLLMAAALLAAAPLHADWLVTVDGVEIETEGAWTVDGSQVVFTLPGGSLAALPAAEVDLAASEARTNPPPPEPPAPEPAKAKAASRWVLTDADVAHSYVSGSTAPGEAGEAAEGEATEGEAAAPAVQGLTVASWEEVDPSEVDSGLALRGTVRNGGNAVATGIGVTVLLYDGEGNLIERGSATPASTSLEPGQDSDFRVDFPDVLNFAGVQFTVEGRGIATSGEAAGGGEDDGGAGS